MPFDREVIRKTASPVESRESAGNGSWRKGWREVKAGVDLRGYPKRPAKWLGISRLKGAKSELT